MAVNSRQIEEKLRELNAQYARELPAKVDRLGELWRSYLNGGDSAMLAEFVRLCHTLAGSGTTFGFPEVTEVARDIEHRLRPFAEEGTALNAHAIEKTSAQLHDLTQAGRRRADRDVIAHTLPAAVALRENHVFILSGDRHRLGEFAAQLRQFQVQATLFDDRDKLLAAIKMRAPTLIALDLDAFADDEAANLLLGEISDICPDSSHTVFLSSQDTLARRLLAARAGADAFVTTPLDVDRFMTVIDRVTKPARSEPFRVMVVDDDADTRDFIRLTLEQTGMRVFSVSSMDDILDDIRVFAPELILTDLYMPECTGVELARVIRQHEEYLRIPVVYLSSETSLQYQKIALGEGADDFLSKPISPAQLTTRIANRIQRYRSLGSLLSHDGLTGLLNHTSFEERFRNELTRADRQDSFFSYIMLDLDYFKSVNDRHGHATGDRVIRTLARLLNQRLRKSDVIGRYGGEEFALLLPDTDLDSATRLVDQIRKDFSQVCHRNETGEEFQATLSAGVALYPDFANAVDVHRAADDALYEAKRAGRNRVVARRSS